MKKVYICSPFAGDTKYNWLKAVEYCKDAIKEGCIPYASHVYFPLFMDDEMPEQRQIGLNEGLEWLRSCDELWVYGEPTTGMKAEIELAEELDIPIIKRG